MYKEPSLHEIEEGTRRDCESPVMNGGSKVGGDGDEEGQDQDFKAQDGS